jgi:hypothetical protein
VIVGVPLQAPLSTVSVWPSRTVPVIVGAVPLTGGVGSILALCAAVAVAVPAVFVAVTTTRVVVPTSAEVSVYVCAVAFGMSVQFEPPASQRRHCYA